MMSRHFPLPQAFLHPFIWLLLFLSIPLLLPCSDIHLSWKVSGQWISSVFHLVSVTDQTRLCWTKLNTCVQVGLKEHVQSRFTADFRCCLRVWNYLCLNLISIISRGKQSQESMWTDSISGLRLDYLSAHPLWCVGRTTLISVYPKPPDEEPWD